MSEALVCILQYIFSTILFLIIHFIVLWKPRKEKKLDLTHLYIFFILFWFAHIFNIVYTGILGWNLEPASLLEENLDTITVSLMVTSFVALSCAYVNKK
jgi:hypothetical protein